MATGRERGWDCELEGTPFRTVRQNGVPLWSAAALPAIAGQPVEVAEHERPWRSWHSGFGWSQAFAPNIYHYTTNMDLRFPRTAIMGPLVTTLTVTGSANVSGFFELGSSFYVLAGRYAKRIDPADDTVKTPNDAADGKDFGSGAVATQADIFDGSAYIRFSSSTKVWQLTSVTWTQASDNVYSDYGGRVWVNDTVGYGLVGQYVSSSNPTVHWVGQGDAPLTLTNYAGNYIIGENTRAVTGITTFDRDIFVAKTDGLYALDGMTGRAPCVLQFGTVNANNGKNLQSDTAGYVWVPSLDGYYRYDSHAGAAVDCSPGRGLPNASPIYGRITAQAQYKGWRYAAVYNGTNTYIMCGREREADEPGIGPMVWHGALAVISTASVDAMYVMTSTTTPRLWFGNGTDCSYIKLPANGDNPLLDNNCSYCSSGSIYLPADDWGVPGTRWQLTGLDIENEGLSASTYIDILTQIDNGTWQTLDRISTAGSARVFIPIAGDWRFSRCAVRLDVTNGSSTSTPKIRAVVGRAEMRPKVRDLISTSFYCSDDVISRFGIGHRLSGKAQVDVLEGLQEDVPVTLKEWWTGRDAESRVLVKPIKKRIVKQEDNNAAAMAVDVSMTVLEELPPAAYFGDAIFGTSYWN